eukprot:gb/GFBE01021730.1/.p1 GENE.gb/GFBE01021730.1/~~gb/GFBE01021730.1/.p1  ORF type:complete len:153 (+),score=23.94 gb/GFBE01021730.1/:1-459(+)
MLPSLSIPNEEDSSLDASGPVLGQSSGSVFTGLISSLRDAFAGLVEAIGRPPRLPFSEQDPPATLLWAADLCIICIVAATLLFVLAFTADNGTEDVEDALEESDKVWGEEGTTFSERMLTRLRVMIVIVLSALSGGLLNVKHSVHSALFHGL